MDLVLQSEQLVNEKPLVDICKVFIQTFFFNFCLINTVILKKKQKKTRQKTAYQTDLI